MHVLAANGCGVDDRAMRRVVVVAFDGRVGRSVKEELMKSHTHCPPIGGFMPLSFGMTQMFGWKRVQCSFHVALVLAQRLEIGETKITNLGLNSSLPCSKQKDIPNLEIVMDNTIGMQP